MTSWSGHWHGYGPWHGSRDAYGQEPLRRPGRGADDPRTQAFLASTLPPLMTGHWLLRRAQTARERTWDAVAGALGWLAETHAGAPPATRPDGGPSCLPLRARLAHARDVLPRGVDVAWVYYLASRNLVSYAVVCCPNRFHPALPCPLPPGRGGAGQHLPVSGAPSWLEP
ncbi:hypothetical protein [Streptomyces marincola]|uniref:hypothetical protein n=1 Tax=Streptomyces marincola TaxID=2878388 RepID=UPI0021006595|nr:hypothetical protein [Streptomyces marincola]